MFFDWKTFLRIFPKKSLFGQSADRYGVERRNLNFFLLASLTNGTPLSLYEVEEEKMRFSRFQLNKQLFAGQIWCGRRKRKKFWALVMKSPVAVPIWCRKRNFFSKMEAKCRFHSLYGAKEEKSEIFSSISLANSTFLSLYGVKGRKQSDFCQNASFRLY